MPRGATAYAAAVFNAAGLHVGHEVLDRDGIATGYVGVHSPGLGTLVLWSQFELVLHQIREPRLVVSSLANEPGQLLHALWEATGPAPSDGLEAILWTYVQIHRRAYRVADYTFRVEDYPKAWDRLRGLVRPFLGPFPAGISTTLNRRSAAKRISYRELSRADLETLNSGLATEAYEMWESAA